MNDSLKGVALAGRRLPFPHSISSQARAALEALVTPDGVPHNAGHPLPALDDSEAWRALQRTINAYYDAAAEAHPSAARASTETVSVGQCEVHIATPETHHWPDAVYLYMHGGAMISGGGKACRETGRRLADRHHMTCVSVDYRLPPDHPYPAALDDCLAAYRYVLQRYERVIVGGQSAGGNLAAALVAKARDSGVALPDGLILLSPEVDLTESGDSFEVNRWVDVRLPDSLMTCNLLYANGADLTHPYLSPLFADVTGWPPTFVQSGTRDLFLSNAVRMHRHLRSAGVAAQLHVFEAMPHGGFGGAPEDEELSEEIGCFLHGILGRGPALAGS